MGQFSYTSNVNVSVIKSKFDLSGKSTTVEDELTRALGAKVVKILTTKKKTKAQKLAGPWKHDFKNHCVKCNKAFHLQRHHIIYSPPAVVFLCAQCHSKITGINTRAAGIAGTSVEYKPHYTNKIRRILWRWFMSNSWPVDSGGKPVKRLSKTKIRNILKAELGSNLLGFSRDNTGECPRQQQLNVRSHSA